ncbi:hypothetical protein A0U40_17925 [[Bacillus] sp. KCTC 13219]|nr:hypothetical protein A0U40_17925 [[Bacillus] sp. KCTC 13219]
MIIRTNFEVETFIDMDLSKCEIPLIVVYERPLDFPNEFVGRLFNVDRPTEFFVRGATEGDIISKIPGSFTRLPRSPADEPHIVCAYI